MSIEHKINVNTHYTRSVNLKRDVGSEVIVSSYIPTSRALKTLGLVCDALKEDESPRAWSLIGPYGSGKSSFASFLANLLETQNSVTHTAANKVLSLASKQSSLQYKSLSGVGLGYCVVLLTGSPDSLSKRLINTLHEKAQQVWNSRRGRKPEILDILSHYNKQKKAPTVNEITDLIVNLQDELAKIGYSGLFLAIDELGKFLEYETRHFGTDNIFLLQDLAELAFSKHKTKLALMVMLHQSIEQYARGLGATQKNEWAKIQGRFESIPFIDTSEQTLRIVARAIEHKLTKSESKTLKDNVTAQVDVLIENGALSSTMDKKTAKNIFLNCYPLHPISALILPILCQKVAQNERTLFSYLGSKESHGFLDSLTNLESVDDQIQPWEVYEYFIRNQPNSGSDQYTSRRWAEVVIAIDRLGDAEEETIKLLKLIGLLNIIGSQGGLKATPKLLEICSSSHSAFKKSIKTLTSNSIVNYRKFNSEYRVWQGSDFDIELSVEDERGKLGRFSLADKLNERHQILPIVARKYSIQTGALRYFMPVFTSKDSYNTLDTNSRDARIIFYLAETADDEKFFIKEILNQFDSDLLVLCPNGAQVREILGEVLALEEVERSSQELTSDPIALREYSDRYNVAIENEHSIVNTIVDSPDSSKWYWKSKKLKITNKHSLQQNFSEILSEIYSSAPIIKNELINRNHASSQANAARKKLVKALLNNLSKEDLDIEKFPAEKSIYRALLRTTGVHLQDSSGHWKLAELSDLDKNNEYNFFPVWEKIDSFFKSTEREPKSLIELSNELLAPPFGIKLAVLPVLYVVAIMAYQEKLALTEENVYVPYLGEAHFDRFFKRPDQFMIQYVDLGGVNHKLIDEYSRGFFTDNKKRSILELTKPIAQFVETLPFYTSQTKTGLTQPTKAFRDAFKLSKSPVKLLLEDLPKALGVDPEDKKSAPLAGLLISSLKELKHAFPKLKEDMANLIADSFHLQKNLSLTEIRKSVSARCKGLENYTVEKQGQKGFIIRTQKTDLSDEAWLDNLLMFVVSKPVKKWTDSDRIAAEYKISILIKNIRDLEKLRISHEDSKMLTSEGEAFMLKSMKLGKKDLEESIIIDEMLHLAASDIKAKMLKILSENDPEPQIVMAALAETVDEFLRSKQKKVKKGSKKSINSKNIKAKDKSNEVA